MKNIFLFISLLISAFIINAQDNVIKILDARNDKIPILVNGEWQIVDHYKIDALLEDNIYSFFKLHDKYPSPLKKQMFEKTSEYNDELLPIFNQAKADLLKTNYAILYTLYRNSNYDVEKRNFQFLISAITPDALKHPNTFSVENFYTFSVPQAAFELETGTIFGRPYERRYFITPVISEEIAVEVEDGMQNHPSPYSLLFIVNIEGIKEQGNSMGFSMPYVLTKAKKAYLYNTETEEVVADLNSIFTIPDPVPQSTVKSKATTRSRK